MTITVNWFVLYVRTASEERVLKNLLNHLQVDIYTPFIPKKAWPYIKKDSVYREDKICFPGYVFIQSKKSVDESIEELKTTIYGIKEAYYFLFYGSDKRDIALRDNERICLEHLMNTGFYIESSIGFIEGDYVKVVSGALLT